MPVRLPSPLASSTAAAAAVLGMLGWFAGSASAATQIQVRPGFNAEVTSITEPDGAGVRYLGGPFTAVNPWDTGAGAALALDTGEVDRSFPKVGGGSAVSAVAADGSGGVYIGGSFSCVGGDGGSDGDCADAGEFPRNGLAHIRADGSVDPNWAPVMGATPPQTPYASAIAVSAGGGEVYIAGEFTTINGISRTRLAMVHDDGTLDSTWNPGASGGVTALAITPISGVVLVGGSFSVIAGQVRSNLAGLDPATGAALSLPQFSVSGGSVNSIAVDPTTFTVYVGGSFTSAGPVGGALTRNRLAAFDSGATLTTWNPNANGLVRAVAAAPGGATVYVGGDFGTVGGQARTWAAEISATTGLATAWAPEPNNKVESLAVSGDSVLLAGSFTTLGLGAQREIRRYLGAASRSTGLATAWNPRPGPFPTDIVVSASRAYVGGSFASVGGTPRVGLAAVDANGAVTSWAPQADNLVNDVELDGGFVYAGGLFRSIDGVTQQGIARISTAGALDQTWAPVVSSGVNALDVVGTTVYFGGNFSAVNAVTRNNLAAVTTGGTLTSWAPSADGTVYEVAGDATAIYVAGVFTTINATAKAKFAAVQPTGAGALIPAFDPQPDDSPTVIVPSGSVVYIGGDFGTVKGQVRRGLAAVAASDGGPTSFDPNVTTDSPTTPGYVAAMYMRGSVLYLGGNFANVSGQARASLAAVDTTGAGALQPWNPGADSIVYGMSADDSAVWVTGLFDRVGGLSSPTVARVGYDGKTLGGAASPSSDTAPATTSGASAGATAAAVTRSRTRARVRVGRSRSFRMLARDAELTGIARVTTKVRVARASARVCRVRGRSVRALRVGLCRYSITTYAPSGARLGRASWAFIVIPRARR